MFPDSKCISDIAEPKWRPDTSYSGPIMVRDVSTKMGPERDVLGTLCDGWVGSKVRPYQHKITEK